MKRIVEQEEHDPGRGRTARRREARDIDKLVLQLVAMKEAEILELPISELLHRELNVAREIRARGARRRQLRFVAGLLRKSEPDLTAIRQFLDSGSRVRVDPLAGMRRLEAWRDDLCEPERFSATLESICKELPHLDRSAVTRLAHTVHDRGDEHKAYRELYKRLRMAADEQERDTEQPTDE